MRGSEEENARTRTSRSSRPANSFTGVIVRTPTPDVRNALLILPQRTCGSLSECLVFASNTGRARSNARFGPQPFGPEPFGFELMAEGLMAEGQGRRGRNTNK